MVAMISRMVWPVMLACMLCAPAGGKEREREPMPSFSGTIKRLDGRSLVLELDDFRTLEFRRTAKTRFFEKKKPLDPARLKPGDAVSVEATEDIDGSLAAVNVYLEHAAQGEPREEDRLIGRARGAARFESGARAGGWKKQDAITAEAIYENGREDYRSVRELALGGAHGLAVHSPGVPRRGAAISAIAGSTRARP